MADELGQAAAAPQIGLSAPTGAGRMRSTSTGRQMLLGRLVAAETEAARTDTGVNGEVSFYVTGGTVRLQMWSDSLGAWTEVTLS